MTRSDLIRGGERLPAFTIDLREPEDPFSDTATDSTGSLEVPITTSVYAAVLSNSIDLFFGDVIECSSGVAIGREEGAHTRKLKNDSRATGISTLRHVSNIDELQPLINVLRGGMSLLGSRPVVQQEPREHLNFAQKGQLL
jgi:hypothetical protein